MKVLSDKIIAESKKAWEDFSSPKKARVMVGAATCGRAAGALDIIAEFKKQLQKAGKHHRQCKHDYLWQQ